MKPIIAITPLWDDKLSSVWMLPGYLDALREAGAVPIILPLEASAEDIVQLCEMCDGFLLTGGHDVDPALYNEPRSEKCGGACRRKDSMERVVFDYAVMCDKPLLGICRGIQIINAFCGGTLYQDLPTERDSAVCHQMTAPYNRVQHQVSIATGSPLHKILGMSTLGVNSYHHQAIKELGADLKAQAHSEDGLVEAVYMPSHSFIQAVQWHPELSFRSDENSRKIVGAFVNACLK